jgi:hypothetical protein
LGRISQSEADKVGMAGSISAWKIDFLRRLDERRKCRAYRGVRRLWSLANQVRGFGQAWAGKP